MMLAFAYDWWELFEDLDSGVRRRIMGKLKEVKRADAWPHEALKGKQFEGLYKLRAGDYRLIYRVLQDGTLDFLTPGHRSEVYHPRQGWRPIQSFSAPGLSAK